VHFVQHGVISDCKYRVSGYTWLCAAAAELFVHFLLAGGIRGRNSGRPTRCRQITWRRFIADGGSVERLQ